MDELLQSVDFIRRRVSIIPRLALILGSGLGDFVDVLPDPTILDAESIPHYPRSTVVGHKGRLVFATFRTVPLVAFQGRNHFYESNDLRSVLFPLRVAHALGGKTVIITNAAGGVNRDFGPGDLMAITDQINLTSEGFPFSADRPSMQPVFQEELITRLDAIARKEMIPLRYGVYAGVKGPSYETAAEVEMVHRLGGDAVGMSTVLEAACAASLGMKVLGISCITNKATGINPHRLDHHEVTDVANKVRSDFTRLLIAFIETC